MKFLTSETAIIAGSVIIISTFSTLLYLDFNKKVQFSGTETVGSITYKRKIAQRKYDNEVVWEDLNKNEPLYNNDTIRTADMSDAVIRMKDGTVIEMGENSMILLSSSTEGIDIDFTQGTIATRRDTLPPKGAGQLRINSKGTTVAIQNSDIKLSKGTDEGLNLVVSRGDAVVRTGSKETLIRKDQKAVIAKDTKVFEISLKLVNPTPNAYVISTGGRRAIDFSWEPFTAKGTVWLEASRDPMFKTDLIRKKADGAAGTSRAELGEGAWYWRLRAENTGESDTRKISVIRDSPVELISPADNYAYFYRAKPPLVNFMWARNELATAYEVVIASDAAMQNTVTTLESVETSIATDTLSAGTYYWKVRTRTGLPGVSYEGTSPVQKLIITAKAQADPPEALSPIDDAKINMAAAERARIVLSWRKGREISTSKIELSAGSGFDRMILTAESRNNFYTINRPLAAGTYFWRVCGIYEDGTLTGYSPPRSFSIFEGGTLELTNPAEGSAIAPVGSEENPTVRFSWKKTDIDGTYRLEISRRDDFRELEQEMSTELYSVAAAGLSTGRYYWRVRLLDRDGSEILTSGTRSITVLERLEKPTTLEPGNGAVVNMQNRNALTLAWRASRDADLYELRLYRSRYTGEPLLTRRTNATSYRIEDLKILDEGNFYWSVQAIDTDAGKNVVRESEPARNSFIITLGKDMEKPKIISPKLQFIK